MNNPYIVELEQLLQDIPQEERQEILQDYREHFRLAQAEGKTQEEIARSLGTPEALAAEILAEYHSAATPPGKPEEVRPPFRWKQAALLGIGAVVLALMIWAVVGIKVVRTTDTSPPDVTPLENVSQLKEALKSAAASSSPDPTSPAAKKSGGVVSIQEERSATGSVRTLRIETVDTHVVIETAKDASPQAILEGQLAVKDGEDWTDYYDYGTDTSGDTFRVFVKPTEAKKQQMPSGRSTTLRIRLPDAPLEDLDVTTVSGTVKGPSLHVDHFNGASVSGSIALVGLQGKSHNLTNVSGKISVGSLSGDFGVESVSGSVRITGTSWESSGSVNTISGSVNLTADAKLPFAYELNSISGSVQCGYDGADGGGGILLKQCSGSTGDSKRTLTLTSVSGPLQVGP